MFLEPRCLGVKIHYQLNITIKAAQFSRASLGVPQDGSQIFLDKFPKIGNCLQLLLHMSRSSIINIHDTNLLVNSVTVFITSKKILSGLFTMKNQDTNLLMLP